MRNAHESQKPSNRRLQSGQRHHDSHRRRKTQRQQERELERFEGETMYSTFGACPNHPEIVFESLEPRMFSFNSPWGACPTCHGLGEITEVHRRQSHSRQEPIHHGRRIGSLRQNGASAGEHSNLQMVGKKHGFDVFTPIKDFTEKQLHVLLYGDREPINGNWSNGANMWMREGWEGVIPQTMRLYRQTESEWRKEDIEKFMTSPPLQHLQRQNACNPSFLPCRFRTKA